MKKRQSQRQFSFGVPGVPGMVSLGIFPSPLGHRFVNKALIDVTKLPPSYTTNSTKEEHLLQVADNFSRQYSHLCPDRVPLFLHPLNECNVPVSLGLGGPGQSRGRGWSRAQGSPPSLRNRKLWPIRRWRRRLPARNAGLGSELEAGGEPGA